MRGEPSSLSVAGSQNSVKISASGSRRHSGVQRPFLRPAGSPASSGRWLRACVGASP